MSHLDKSTCLLGDGKEIPWVGFGTYLSSSDDVRSSCAYALECGYMHIDTAEGYKSEEDVGYVLANTQASKPFITTKLWPGMEGNVKTYEETIESCQASIAKLGIEYVDLYLIHAPFGGPIGRIEQWRALVELQRRGLCKSIGVSNFSVKHLEELKSAGLPLPAANQLELHPLCQHRDIVEYCKLNNILPIAYSSLAPLSSWRPGQRSAKLDMNDPSSTHCELYNTLSEKYSISPAQLLLRWALQHGWPVLPKSINSSRIESNFQLFHFNISDDDMCALDGLDENLTFAWPNGDPCLSP